MIQLDVTPQQCVGSEDMKKLDSALTAHQELEGAYAVASVCQVSSVPRNLENAKPIGRKRTLRPRGLNC